MAGDSYGAGPIAGRSALIAGVGTEDTFLDIAPAAATLAAWVSTDGFGNGGGQVLADPSDVTGRFWLQLLSDGADVQVLTETGSAASPQPTPNGWHHLAATFDAAASPSLKLYVDGVIKADDTPTDSVGWTQILQIVAGQSGGIAEAGIWGVVLTPAEVAAIATGAVY
jgi:hypothetical protein